MPQRSSSPLRPLYWRIQDLARAQGILSPSQLSVRMQSALQIHIPRQGLYGPWNGTAKSVDVLRLQEFARFFQVDPGDWFRWEGAGNERRLVWNIGRELDDRGWTMTKLSWAAEIHYGTAFAIATGTAVSVFVATLARMAEALDLPTQHFAIGDLFTWAPPTDRPFPELAATEP